jgi:hypothetical protein
LVEVAFSRREKIVADAVKKVRCGPFSVGFSLFNGQPVGDSVNQIVDSGFGKAKCPENSA